MKLPIRIALAEAIVITLIAGCGGGGGSNAAAGGTAPAPAPALAATNSTNSVTPAPAPAPTPAPTPTPAPAPAPSGPMVTIPAAGTDTLFTSVTPTADAAEKGMFGPLADWPFIGLHASLLPNGKVLTHGASQVFDATTGQLKDAQLGFDFDEWTPSQGIGASSHRTLIDPLRFDSFCSSTKMMSDGTLMIAGGNGPPYGGNGDQTTLSHRFDPVSGQLTAMLSRLNFQRWYGTMVRMPDDSLVIMGGGDAYAGGNYYAPTALVSTTPEVFTREAGWQVMTGAASDTAFGRGYSAWFYPRAWVAPSGKIFGISHKQMWELDAAGNGSIRMTGRIATENVGPASSAVMYDAGKILQVGGGQLVNEDRGVPGQNAATTIDINGAQPVVTTAAPMNFPRNWPNATVLPDGRVLVNGGGRIGNADDGAPDAVYDTELWNPDTGQWTIGARATRIRVYHSVAMLLPNGTVLTGAGGVPGPEDNRNMEVYYPPYLFKRTGSTVGWADRVRMTSISQQLAYGSSFALLTSDARRIKAVKMISIGAVTHSHNMDQRKIALPHSQTGNNLTVSLPSNRALLPPGHYLLFVLDDSGVPSRGHIVELKK